MGNLFFISKPGKTQDAGNFLWRPNCLSLKNHCMRVAEVEVAQNSETDDDEVAAAALISETEDEVVASTEMIDPETGAKNETLTGVFDNLLTSNINGTSYLVLSEVKLIYTFLCAFIMSYIFSIHVLLSNSHVEKKQVFECSGK